MRPLRIAIAALASVFAWGLGAGPAAASEGEGKRFFWHPSLRFVSLFDDNPFFESSGGDSDFGFWIRPRIEAGYRGRGLGHGAEVGGDVGADIRRYVEHSSLDEEFLRLRAYGELGLLPGLTARVENVLTPQPLVLGFPEDSSANLLQTNRVTGELRYWRELPRGRELEVAARGARLDGESYDSAQAGTGGDDARPDYTEASGYAELQSPLGRRLASFARTQARHRFFDELSRSDFTDVAVLGGLRLTGVRDVELELAGGWGLIAFSSRRDTHRFVGNGRLRHHLGSGLSWGLSAWNRFTADLAGNDVFETTGRLRLDKRFGERMGATLSGFITHFENESVDDDNLFGGTELRLRRQLTRRAQLALSYRHWVNGGSLSNDDFNQNRVTLEFSYRR